MHEKPEGYYWRAAAAIACKSAPQRLEAARLFGR